MSGSFVRNGVATVGAFAIAAGFVVVSGAGLAGAAPETVNFTDGGNSLTRTVNNTTPAEGETVTVATTITGVGTVDWFEDNRPTCLTYKPNTARVGGLPVPVASVGAGLIRVAGAWDAATSPVFSFEYLVQANCTRDVVQTTGMKYGSGGATGSFVTQGPSVTVPKNATTTVLSPIAPGAAGTAIKMDAQVLGGHDGELVRFFSGTTLLGSAPLAAGKASYTWTPAASQAGDHQITATFVASPLALESSSAAQTLTVAPGNQTTKTTVTVPVQGTVNTDVLLEAQVEPFPGAGTVTFKAGTAELGTVDVGPDGKASLVQVFTVTGNKSITAVFSGAPGFTASTSPAQVVRISEPGATDVATTVTLGIPAQAEQGKVVFLTANVSPMPDAGTVRFYSGEEPLGNPTRLASGRATQTYTFTTLGHKEIRAVYTGAVGFLGSDVTGGIEVIEPLPPSTSGSLGNLFGSS
ncbi:Ig-like domain-containing protein [Rhodococcus kronopolitis]|uniref:Ig-like domain-containing protein n=1 Tax=Rhodococcus kronopolitis TaxID=1460226 RepID=A0ABV9FYK1_9NOCA